MATCYALASTWGDELDVGPSLLAWSRAEAARRRRLAKLARAKDADLPYVRKRLPVLFGSLAKRQRAGAAWIREAGPGRINGDEAGSGKTRETLAGLLDKPKKEVRGAYLIICPRLSIRNVWIPEVRALTPYSIYGCGGTKPQRLATIRSFLDDPSKVKFLAINAEMVRMKPGTEEGELVPEYPELLDIEWKEVIVDESHKWLGSMTIARRNQVCEGLVRLRTGGKLAVSGTPFGKGGRVRGMFGTLHWIDPSTYSSFWRWAEEVLEVEEDDFGHPKVGGLKEGITETDFYNSMDSIILRRTKAEVMKGMPPKQYQEMLVDMSPVQEKQYREMELDAAVTMYGQKKNGKVKAKKMYLSADSKLAEMTRLKMFAAATWHRVGDKLQAVAPSCKVDAVMQLLDERGILDGSGTQKVIVFSQFIPVINLVTATLEEKNVDYRKIVGGMSDRAMERSCLDFQREDGPRVMMLSTAGGISITLDMADTVIMMDELWNPEDNSQIEDRAHRRSRKHHVLVIYLRTRGTIETQHVRGLVEEKRRQQFVVLDGRRGLDYAERLVDKVAS